MDFVFAFFSDEDLDVECSNWSVGAKDTLSENKHYIQPKWKKKKKGRKNNLEEEDILCLYNIGKDIRKCCLGSSWIFMKYIYGKKTRRLPMCVTCNVKRLYNNNVIRPHCGLWIYTYSLAKSEIGFLDFCFMIIEIKKKPTVSSSICLPVRLCSCLILYL